MALQDERQFITSSIKMGTQLDAGKTAVASPARSRSTSASSSQPIGTPGSDTTSAAASPDCQAAVPYIHTGWSPIDRRLEELRRPLMLDSLLRDETAPTQGVCPPPGLEGATPAALAFGTSEYQENDKADEDSDGDDGIAWAVASLAAEMALCSPLSEPKKLTQAALEKALEAPSQGQLRIPPPPPLQAPALSTKESSPMVEPPTRPPALPSILGSPACAPPNQPPALPKHLQRSPILPPPPQSPNMSAKWAAPPAPPPSQPPVLHAAMLASAAVPPPPLAPILRLADAFPVPEPSASTLRLADAFPEPGPDTSSLASVGSEQHRLGTCKPCAFLYTKGCGNGARCQFCHLCTPGEKKRRLKEKRALLQRA